MPSTLHDAASAPAALSAFLRGVERRGAVFAELQCGDQEAGDTALAASMRAFRAHAGAAPMADWPRRFWMLLVANPQLRQSAATAAWPTGLGSLARLEASHRQALLLRLAAGLDETEAAAVLGLELARYEQALAAACPHDADGQPDPVAWRALADAIQRQLRDLPPQRLLRLVALREAALKGDRVQRAASKAQAGPWQAETSLPRRRWPWIVLVAAVCMAALAATWWWPHGVGPLPVAVVEDGVQRLQDEVDIEYEPLPAQAPAARFDPAAGVLLHPDFELVKEAPEEAIAREADFLAWVASGANELPDNVRQDEMADAPVQATGTETTDAQF